jgi:hypothetical protein
MRLVAVQSVAVVSRRSPRTIKKLDVTFSLIGLNSSDLSDIPHLVLCDLQKITDRNTIVTTFVFIVILNLNLSFIH